MQSPFNGNHRLNHFMRQTFIRIAFCVCVCATSFDACVRLLLIMCHDLKCSPVTVVRLLYSPHDGQMYLVEIFDSKRNRTRVKKTTTEFSDAAIFFFVVIYYS